jgi:hypothetical protein
VRYLAIATLLVIAFLVILTNLPHGSGPPEGGVRYSSSTATPGPAQNADRSRSTPRPVRGNAPWALSALPECFQQVSERSGSAAFARAKVPRDAQLVPAGLRLRVADCTLDVARSSAVVARGDDRFFVPPRTQFFVAGRHVVLDRVDSGRVDVRVYALRDGAVPRFERTQPGQPLRRRVESHT